MRHLLATIATGALLAAPAVSLADQHETDSVTMQDLEAAGFEELHEYEGGLYRGQLADHPVLLVVFDRDVGIVPDDPAAMGENEEEELDRAAAAADAADPDDPVVATPDEAAPGLPVEGLEAHLEEQGFSDVQQLSAGQFFTTTSDGRTLLVISAEGVSLEN